MQPWRTALLGGDWPVVRVVVADGDAGRWAGLRTLLEASNFRVVAEVDDAMSAVEACRGVEPDVCLIDRNLAGAPSAVCRAISAEHPDVDPVLLADSCHDDGIFEALRSGAVGFVPRSVAPPRLANLVRRAIAGDITLTRPVIAGMLDAFDARVDVLCERERAVLEQLAAGLPTRTIAVRLGTPLVDVHAAVKNIIRKLSVIDVSEPEADGASPRGALAAR